MASSKSSKRNVVEELDELLNKHPTKKKRSQKTDTKKWSWKDEFVEALIGYIKEYKTLCDFNAIDFEADLKELYTELHRCMASSFPEEFGPDKVTEPSTGVKDMSSDEYALYKKTTAEEKIKISKVYDRIKTKVKSIRQDYRTAVNKGTRSGSGKLVKEHFDTLCEIWGGSPATTMMVEGVDGDSILLDDTDPDQVKSSTASSEEPDSSLIDELADTDKESTDKESVHGTESSSLSQVPTDETGMTTKAKMSVSAVPRLVDNKRKQMEKTLSQSKRDQILMNSTKEDLIMKKQMIAALEQSNTSLQATMEKMTDSLSSMAEGISSGMQMIAMAMASPPQQQYQSYQPANYSGIMYPSAMHGSHAHAMGFDSVRHPPELPVQSGQFLTSMGSARRSYTPSPTPSDQASVLSDENNTAGYGSHGGY